MTYKKMIPLENAVTALKTLLKFLALKSHAGSKERAKKKGSNRTKKSPCHFLTEEVKI